jgi:hypothetical protein
LVSFQISERSLVLGRFVDFEFGAGEFQNTTLHEAERAPRKLNEFNHADVLRERRRDDKRKASLLFFARG